ncbi:MAG: diheme cytochrome c [Motiliproteus sp.]
MTEKLSTWRWTLGGVLLSSAIGIGIWGFTVMEVRADRGEFKSHDRDWTYQGNTPNPIYSEECGSCHLAYPAGMLPIGSWLGIMAGLEDHFGESAEVDRETQQQLEIYLLSGAADNNDYQNRRYLGAPPSLDNPVLRITELPYFIRKHDEIPSRWVSGNDKVGSFSQCDSCHQTAAKGDFDDDGVVIPGYGRWDD